MKGTEFYALPAETLVVIRQRGDFEISHGVIEVAEILNDNRFNQDRYGKVTATSSGKFRQSRMAFIGSYLNDFVAVGDHWLSPMLYPSNVEALFTDEYLAEWKDRRDAYHRQKAEEAQRKEVAKDAREQDFEYVNSRLPGLYGFASERVDVRRVAKALREANL